MNQYIENARIIITHGGPSSFIMPLQIGKTPIVVPRQAEFGEHVNDHQVDFVKMVAERFKNILPIYDINDLKDMIINYNKIIIGKPVDTISNNQHFNDQFKKIVDELFA